jgi:hypothetical protein
MARANGPLAFLLAKASAKASAAIGYIKSRFGADWRVKEGGAAEADILAAIKQLQAGHQRLTRTSLDLLQRQNASLDALRRIEVGLGQIQDVVTAIREDMNRR